MTGDDTNVFYTERIGKEPSKSVVDRKRGAGNKGCSSGSP